MIGITSNAGAVAGQYRVDGLKVATRVAPTVAKFGALLVTKVRANASGRPGPRAITGDYRRSWGMELSGNGATTSALVSTNRPQGRRLEFGFVGADSLGRHFSQPPYAHAGPALDAIGPKFELALRAIVDAL